jgi:hypothetical protein
MCGSPVCGVTRRIAVLMGTVGQQIRVEEAVKEKM